MRLIAVAQGDATHKVITFSILEEAGIKMPTDEELGADKAYIVGAEETAVKKSHTAQSSATSL